MTIVPSFIVSVSSAWNPSSPVRISKSPPSIVTDEFEWTESSYASILNVPPEIWSSPSLLNAFMLVVSEESVEEDEVFPKPKLFPPFDIVSGLPPPVVIPKSPPVIVRVPAASTPSPSEVTFRLPPVIVTFPSVVSSLFSAWMPSLPDTSVSAPPLMVRESLTFTAWFSAVISYVPLSMTSVSFAFTP